MFPYIDPIANGSIRNYIYVVFFANLDALRYGQPQQHFSMNNFNEDGTFGHFTAGDRGDGQGCNFFGSIFFPSKQYIDTITEFSFEFYSRKLLINVKILGCGNYLIV